MYEWQDKLLDPETGSIIEALSDRIVHFYLGPNGLRVVEGCDGYFGVTLSPDQVDQFIAELVALRAKM